jgi:hypothetical protein
MKKFNLPALNNGKLRHIKKIRPKMDNFLGGVISILDIPPNFISAEKFNPYLKIRLFLNGLEKIIVAHIAHIPEFEIKREIKPEIKSELVFNPEIKLGKKYKIRKQYKMFKKTNKKRLLILLITIPTMLIPVFLLWGWYNFDKGRKSSQLITLTNPEYELSKPVKDLIIKIG